jgi:L-asparaginase/Glu-tRNA(Gln) amidotransferase subunit D
MMIDSLDMSDDDLAVILEHCRHAPRTIVITHGTDAAGFDCDGAAEHHSSKTIILTAPMVPLQIGSSDDC